MSVLSEEMLGTVLVGLGTLLAAELLPDELLNFCLTLDDGLSTSKGVTTSMSDCDVIRVC